VAQVIAEAAAAEARVTQAMALSRSNGVHQQQLATRTADHSPIARSRPTTMSNDDDEGASTDESGDAEEAYTRAHQQQQQRAPQLTPTSSLAVNFRSPFVAHSSHFGGPSIKSSASASGLTRSALSHAMHRRVRQPESKSALTCHNWFSFVAVICMLCKIIVSLSIVFLKQPFILRERSVSFRRRPMRSARLKTAAGDHDAQPPASIICYSFTWDASCLVALGIFASGSSLNVASRSLV
jgi:hypothetical protein